MCEPINSLKRRRKRLGYSQERFAALAGVTERTYRSWESGVRVPQLVNQQPLRRALGIDQDEFEEVLAEIERDQVEFLAGRRPIPSDDADDPPPPESAQR